MLNDLDNLFVTTGVEAFNSVFKDVPSEKAQEIKAAIIAQLQKDATNTAPDTIVVTIDKFAAFVDAGMHYSTNAKAINITDTAKALIDKLATGTGFFGMLGGLLKLNSLIKT